MSETFNPEMLVLARESEGVTQSELARSLSMAQGSISKIESGMLSITHEQLERIANKLDFPASFFFQPDPIYGYGSSCYYHRKRQNIPVTDIKRVLAQINILRIQLTKLLRGAEIETDNKFHRFDIVEYDNSPEKIARLVRGAWNLPPGPVQSLVGAIEDAGGVVFKCSFGTKKIDAISQWLPGLPPLFFVNADIPSDRCRYTLAHELGHLIMHQIPTSDIEREADRFAAEFLMPEKEIGPHLRHLSIQRLAAMKPYWKVSMAAILRRSFDIGKITVSTYRKLNTQISKYGLKLNEPAPIPNEEPEVIRDIIDVHRKDHGYSLMELLQLIRSTERKYRRFYLAGESESPTEPRLQLVG
jgi:Zn-dependent peptidase ImmA (M78 family)/transcriptional regulator with XRE-family HTH domain